MDTITIILVLLLAAVAIYALFQVNLKKGAKNQVEQMASANEALRNRNQELNNEISNLKSEISWQVASTNFTKTGDIIVRPSSPTSLNILKNGTVHFTLKDGKLVKSYFRKGGNTIPAFLCIKK